MEPNVDEIIDQMIKDFGKKNVSNDLIDHIKDLFSEHD
jgi:hypothetical protein